jgi:hypothetical protein
MSQPQEICQTTQICSRLQPFNQQRQNLPPLTEQKIKEIVMDTLIELNLIAKTEKKKGLPDV